MIKAALHNTTDLFVKIQFQLSVQENANGTKHSA